MTRERPPAFAVRGLGKQFLGVAAISDVSFTVPTGSTAALIGPPGAGKTTILHILLGLIEPTHGSAAVGGPGTGAPPDAAPSATARVIGAVLAPRGLHPARSARDHLRVYAAACGLADERVEQVLETVGLDARTRVRAGALTPGEQTRLALATALLPDPPLLVLDDPYAGLDPAERGWLQDCLRRHTRRGGTVLLSSQTLSGVLPGADQLIVLNAGSVVYQGTAARLRRSHPDRLVVAAATPIALATMLAARGFTDAVIRPDGRLAVAEATEEQIRDAAAAAGVRVDSIVADPIHPDRVLAALLKPPTRPVTPTSGIAEPPTPTPIAGIPR